MDENNTFVAWFRSVAPYIHAHRGKTFVLYITGEATAAKNFPHLLHDIALLNSLAIKLVVVFGTRPQINALLKQKKMTPQYNGLLRVTDQATIQIVKQAAAEVDISIKALLSMGLPNSPMAGAKIKVASGNYINGKPYGVIDGIDLGLTGQVRKIDSQTINERLEADEIVLIPPLAYSITGEVFNLSALALATEVAIDLAADKLIMLHTQLNLADKDNNIIKQMTCAEAKEKLAANHFNDTEEAAALTQGIKACEAGVKRIHFIDQNSDGSILRELFSRDGIGTLLMAEPFDITRKATINDIGGILELIKPLEDQGVLVKRSREKIEIDINDYTVITRDGMVIACAALHDYPDNNIMELACMAVHPDYQNQATGSVLYQFTEATAIKKGAKMLFVLTTQAVHWFLARGFTETTISDIPVKKQFYNLQRQSKALMKQL